MIAYLLAACLAAPPLSPTEAKAAFKLPPGFRIDCVAAEPDVIDPVAMSFDADGRLYVAEMPGYPNGGIGTGEPNAKGRIRRLEDRDGDGLFETSIVFADGLRFPTGVCAWRNGVLVGDAPDLLFIGDSDGDGKADVRRTLYTGFGNRNIQQMINSLQFHVDGWVYGCNGANESDIRSLETSSPPVPLRGRHFRFQPDKPGSLEPLSGGGQYGLSPNEEGVWFTSTNAEHIKQIAFEDRYLRNNPRLAGPPLVVQASDHDAAAKVFRISPFEDWRLERTSRRAADPKYRNLPKTELVPGGFVTSGCGTLVYRGGGFPTSYEGSAFVCDPANNLIHRDVLNPAGVLFKATRGHQDCEFLASTDRWFRPVFLAVGADAALYVADFYREIIETPLSLPQDIQNKNNLNSRGRGRIWRITRDPAPRTPTAKLSSLSNAELVASFESVNSWVRLTAQRLLIERHSIDLDTIQQLHGVAAKTNEAIPCKHALATLKGLGQAVNAPLAVAIKDGGPMLQEEALRLAEPLSPQPEAVKSAAFGLATWSAPRVRFQLACSLGGCDDPRMTDALERILRQDPRDPWLQAAVLSAAGPKIGAELLERLAFDRTVPDGFIGQLVRSSSMSDATYEELLLKALEAALNDKRVWPTAEALLAKVHIRDRRLHTYQPTARLQSALLDCMHGSKRTLDDRLAAARLYVATGAADPNELAKLISATSPANLQLFAVQSLAASEKGCDLLTRRWKELSPTAKLEALETMVRRPETARTLASAVAADRIPSADLTAFRHRLDSSKNSALRELASKLKSEARTRQSIVDRFKPAVSMASSADHGKAVFQKHCAVCHRLGNEGPQVGPDLRAALTNKTKDALLIDLFDPNREVDPRYVNYVASLSDGRTAAGLIAAETANSVTLRRSGGVDETILRADLEALKSSGVSVMPENFESTLSVQETADLLAYLMANK
jgi:putative membrane-bound dehydrogenase-like protein